MNLRDSTKRMLEGLARGRQAAITQAKARGAMTRAAVLQAARDDQARGYSPKGRAARIAKRLQHLVKRRQVQNILATLSSVANTESHSSSASTASEKAA